MSGTGAGAPTGTVTFTFFDNGTCMGAGSPAGAPTLSAGTATSSSEGPAPGRACQHSFSATYGGDSNYGSSVGACEPFTVATPPPPPCTIAVTVSPNPLVETGQSEVHGVVQVEACPSFAGDLVNIDSSQLNASCASLSYETVAGGLPRWSPSTTSSWSSTTTATPRWWWTAPTAPPGTASSRPTWKRRRIYA